MPTAGSSSATARPGSWALADECFPDAIQIVDIFHAKSHLWDVAKARGYTPGSELAAQWAKQRRDELDAGRISAIVAALAHHAAKTCDRGATANASTVSSATVSALRYPACRASGLCVATGVVEAGCKHAHRVSAPGSAPECTGPSTARQCHPRPAQLHPQRPLRRLLGTTKRRCMRQRPTNLTCTQIAFAFCMKQDIV